MSALSSLPPATRGVLWMAGASVFFAVGYIPVRELSPKFTAYEMVFYRSLITVVAMLPWLARVGLGRLRTRRVALYGGRAVLTYSGMLCLFYGLANMPLADATALVFTAPPIHTRKSGVSPWNKKASAATTGSRG